MDVIYSLVLGKMFSPLFFVGFAGLNKFVFFVTKLLTMENVVNLVIFRLASCIWAEGSWEIRFDYWIITVISVTCRILVYY